MGILPNSEYRRFERLVHAFQHRIFGFAFYLLTDREEAEDVTQEVLLRLWDHRGEVEEERALAWLLRVTRNACIDSVRKRTSFRRLINVDSESLDRASTYDPTPDECAEQADFKLQLENALRGLQEPHRSIVILREIQDMKYEDIAEVLDLPLNTVKVYLHRGRRFLREQLSEVLAT